MASDRSDSHGNLDLYTFELRSDIRPSRTVWIKGKVYDKKTGKGLPSAVELTELSGKEISSKVQTDENGNYLITLPIGKDYAFNVNRKGYLFYSANFPMSQKSPDITYNVDIPLQPIELNASIVLKNIFFDSKMFELKTESTTELDKVVQLLKDNPTLKIEISGHTDNIGKATDNLQLSEKRAQSVVKYLALKGIAPERLSSKGYGANQPVAPNTTEEGRSQNRRTELKILSR
ncbi:MAG: OmpA family protein [Chitinophagaceae bacterium]|nr:OmpA family protein [Chitinophagaceae bacterium]